MTVVDAALRMAGEALTAFLSWLRLAVEDPTAFGTLLLAGATFWLAMTARREIRDTRISEERRRAELQIAEADPLLVEYDFHHIDREGRSSLTIEIANKGAKPVVAVKTTIRSPIDGRSETPSGFSMVAPKASKQVNLGLTPFLDTDPVVEVVVVSHGIMNQEVVQRFDWRLDEVLKVELGPEDIRVLREEGMDPPLYASSEAGHRAWAMRRLEINPTVGEGVTVTHDP